VTPLMVDHAPWQLIPVVWVACLLALAVIRRRDGIRNRHH
jgi:hypothetical protein